MHLYFLFCVALVPQGLCFRSSLFISIFASPQSPGVAQKWRIVCFHEKLVTFFIHFEKPMTRVNLLSSWQYYPPSVAYDQWMNSAKALSCTNNCSNTLLNKFSPMVYSTLCVYYSLFGCLIIWFLMGILVPNKMQWVVSNRLPPNRSLLLNMWENMQWLLVTRGTTICWALEMLTSFQSFSLF